MNATNYSKGTLASTNYGTGATKTDVLLLETGDELLQQNEVVSLLLASGGILASNYSGIALNASGYGPKLVKTLLLEIEEVSRFLLQDETVLFLEEIEGKGVDLVDSIIKPLQSSFDDIASRSGIMVSVDDVITKFSSQIDELQKIATTEADSLAKKLIKEADLFINKWGGQAEIPVGELTNLRRTIDNLIPESTFLKDPITAGKNRIVRNIYQETIQAATQGLTDAAGRSLKEIGEELHKLYSFRGIAAQQAGLGVGTLPVGLIKIIAAGGGAAAGGIKGFLAGLGLSSLGNNPKIIAYLAKNLPIVGQAIQGLPEKQAARIITDVFRRLLTNIGAVEISKFGQEK